LPDLARLSAYKAIDFSCDMGIFNLVFMFIFDPEIIMSNIVVHMVMAFTLSLPRDGMVVCTALNYGDILLLAICHVRVVSCLFCHATLILYA